MEILPLLFSTQATDFLPRFKKKPGASQLLTLLEKRKGFVHGVPLGSPSEPRTFRATEQIEVSKVKKLGEGSYGSVTLVQKNDAAYARKNKN